MSGERAIYNGFKLPFGEYKGQTLSEIAHTKKGLLYLDRLVDWKHLRAETKHILQTFLASPSISQRIDRALEDDED